MNCEVKGNVPRHTRNDRYVISARGERFQGGIIPPACTYQNQLWFVAKCFGLFGF